MQTQTRKGVTQMSLESALITVRELSSEVLNAVRRELDLQALGVIIEFINGSYLDGKKFRDRKDWVIKRNTQEDPITDEEA